MYRVRRTVDAGLIAELQKKYLDNCPQYPANDSFWWVVEHGFKVIGFAGYTPCKNGEVYMCRAAIDPNHRGRGLHKRLIRARLTHAKKNGWKKAVTDTRFNPASANNLIACGFKMYAPDEPWSFKDSCYWYRHL